MGAIIEDGTRNHRNKRVNPYCVYDPAPEKFIKTQVPQSMLSGCICLLCNEYRGDITNLHAESHRFANKQEMILQGHIHYMDRKRQLRMEAMILEQNKSIDKSL